MGESVPCKSVERERRKDQVCMGYFAWGDVCWRFHVTRTKMALTFPKTVHDSSLTQELNPRVLQ